MAAKGAWDMVTYYAREVSLLKMRSASAEWIASVDANFIAAAIAKERAECETLERQMDEIGKRRFEISAKMQGEDDVEEEAVEIPGRRRSGFVANRIREFEGSKSSESAPGTSRN